MFEGLKQLLELQDLDGELRRFEEEHAKLPSQRERIEGERAASEEKIVAFREALQAAEAAQRSAESELRDKEALLEKLEGQQHQVKSNEAYTALLGEMEQARQVISDCETRILEAMEGIETAGESLGKAEHAGSETAKRLEGETRELDARQKDLEAGIARAREAREAARSQHDAELLSQYDRIAVRRWPPLALVEGERCLGCRVGIPPQDYIEILRGERVITCGTCQRILVHREMVAPSG